MKEIHNTLFLGLNQEITLAGELLALLKDEKTALTSVDDSKMSLHSQQKEKLVERLQAATNQRTTDMQTHQINKDYIQRHGDLENLFAQLAEISTLCLEENRYIGQLIHRRSGLIKSLLGKMTGTLPSADMTYGANGQAEPVHNTRNHIAL